MKKQWINPEIMDLNISKTMGGEMESKCIPFKPKCILCGAEFNTWCELINHFASVHCNCGGGGDSGGGSGDSGGGTGGSELGS